MAKTPKLKKSTPSLHSRASKRTLPSSLDTRNPPSPSLERPAPSVLLHHHGAGVTKRKAGKGPKRQQRLRQERGMARAEKVRDVRAVKREKSVGRKKVARERGIKWEELNEKIMASGKRKKDRANASEVAKMDEWQDEDEHGDLQEPARVGVGDEESGEYTNGDGHADGKDGLVLPVELERPPPGGQSGEEYDLIL
ncbi:hypothetical protein MMC07_000528 [Pseudocyphellaria aurata]|nr:hypothetical protein [Pseudocyphellaria aurata]